MVGSPAPLQPNGRSPKQRYIFIDLYRSAVILLMLEGHVFRAFLPTNIQRMPFFQFHEFFHGLSAPAFLFGAGLTFVISTRRRWEEYHHWDPPLARRVKRLLLVILLGLGLHLPFYSIRKIIIDCTTTDYLQLFQFDVLHCIGLGLLSLHALIFFFKKESRFYALVFSTIITTCFVTPIIWDIDFLKYLPASLAQMFNGNNGSPFPLFPYVGFLYAGVIVSWEYLVAAECKREKSFMRWLAIIGMVLIICGYLFDVIPVHIYPTYNYWFTSPSYFFVRTGSLMVITAAFWYLAQHIKQPKKVFIILGIESLFVYVLHLIILYGSAVNSTENLQVIFGSNLSMLETTGVFIGMFVLMIVAASLWNYLKEKHFNLYRIIQLSVSTVFLYFLLTRDF